MSNLLSSKTRVVVSRHCDRFERVGIVASPDEPESIDIVDEDDNLLGRINLFVIKWKLSIDVVFDPKGTSNVSVFSMLQGSRTAEFKASAAVVSVSNING